MSIQVQGRSVPSFMYGTAWKEDRTEELTRLALEAGFRAIDTANQRKHYYEEGVGNALRGAFRDAVVERSELFLQTKFTYERGQDHRLPYDPTASFTVQVEQSFASSCEHLGVDTIDSYILHGPAYGEGWGDEDREVWAAMEELKEAGKVGVIGVSNVTEIHLRQLFKDATVKPAFVQNRCYAMTGWDASLRALCAAHDVVYQGFSLLTANRGELARPAVAGIARRHNATVPQVVFAFARAVGMLPLTGTSSPEHMAQDLASLELTLSENDVATLTRLGI